MVEEQQLYIYIGLSTLYSLYTVPYFAAKFWLITFNG